MANLSVTAANLRMLEGIEARLIPMIADATIAKGQVVYRKSNGRADLARGNAVGTAKPVGIATSDAVAGQAFEALYHGRLVGYDLSGVNPGSTVYLSASAAGAIDGAAVTGTGNVVAPIGTVHVMTDIGGTRFLLIDVPQNAAPAALP